MPSRSLECDSIGALLWYSDCFPGGPLRGERQSLAIRMEPEKSIQPPLNGARIHRASHALPKCANNSARRSSASRCLTLLTGVVFPLALAAAGPPALPAPGWREPHRPGWGRRLRADRAGIHRARLLPPAPLRGRPRLRRDGLGRHQSRPGQPEAPRRRQGRSRDLRRRRVIRRGAGSWPRLTAPGTGSRPMPPCP